MAACNHFINLNNHGVIDPYRALAGARSDGDEVPGQPRKEIQPQPAMGTIEVVLEPELLLTIGGGFEVIHVQHDVRRRAGITSDELLDMPPERCGRGL